MEGQTNHSRPREPVGSVGNSAIRNGWSGTRAQGAFIHDKRRDHHTALAPENPRDQPGIQSRLSAANRQAALRNCRWSRCDCSSICRLQACAVVVSLLIPIVTRPLVRVGNPTNLLDLLDAVFQGSDKAKRRPVIWGEWLAVHLIDEQCLGMQGHLPFDANVILTVRRLEGDILRQIRCKFRGMKLAVVPDVRWELSEKITQAYSAPRNDLAPTLNTLELWDHFDVREFPYIFHRQQQSRNSLMGILPHFHRLYAPSRPFGIVLVHDKLLRRHAGIIVIGLRVRGIGSVHPRGDVFAVLLVRRGISNPNEFKR